MPPIEPHTPAAVLAQQRAADPYAARVHVGRRPHPLKEAMVTRSVEAAEHATLRDRTVGFLSGLSNPHRVLMALVAVASVAVAVAAVAIDLSPLDPTGPGLGWSPGVIVIAVIVVLALFGGRDQPRL
jgi:hypothetical protein